MAGHPSTAAKKGKKKSKLLQPFRNWMKLSKPINTSVSPSIVGRGSVSPVFGAYDYFPRYGAGSDDPIVSGTNVTSYQGQDTTDPLQSSTSTAEPAPEKSQTEALD